MLGHIRSGTLDRFKEAFASALNGGKGFAVSARDCTEFFMSQFDKAAAGTRIYVSLLYFCIISNVVIYFF